jgi:hypothetical protein
MESTDPAMPVDNVPDLGEALKAILALGPAGVPSGHSGQTVRDGLEQLQHIINESLMAHLNGGADERVKAAYRAGRASVEAIIETVGRESQGDVLGGAHVLGDVADVLGDVADVLGGAADVLGGAPAAAPEAAGTAGPEAGGDVQEPDRDTFSAEDRAEERKEPPVVGRNLPPDECVGTVLCDLWTNLAADDETAVFAAAYRVDDDPGAGQLELTRQRWERLHLMCLRFNSEWAELWRRDVYERIAGALRENGHEPGIIQLAEAGQGAAAPEIPGLREIGYPGTAPFSAEAGLPEQLAKSAEGLDERWLPLARFAAIAYWLDEHDPQLYGGLAGTHTSDRRLRPPGTRSESYRQELTARVGDLAREHAGNSKELSRAVSVDEAIRGLVPIPFPAPGSWWTEFSHGLEETLTTHLSHQLFVPMPGMMFSSMSGKVELESPVVSPELVREYRLPVGVVWVLRLGYSQHIIPSKSKARVVYVSSG